MNLLIDESVTQDVIVYLRALDKSPFLLIESKVALGFGESDERVVAYANERSAIVLTSNYKHFDQLISRRPNGHQRYRFAGRVCFRCEPPRERMRVETLMPRILSECRRSKGESDQRVIIDIADDWIRFHR